MAIVQTLSNVKRLQRSARLRENISDEEMLNIMDEIIQTGLVAQASGNNRMVRRSIEEMKQVRRDLITGNVLAGSRGKRLIGKFGNLVDQLEEQEQKTKLGGNLAESLPSADTLVSAVMTANPVLGFSTKILRDIGGTLKNAKKNNQEIQRQRLRQLEEGREQLRQELDASEEMESTFENVEMKDQRIVEVLETIEGEIRLLREIWDDTTEIQTDQGEKTNNKLSRLVDAENRVIEEQRLRREQEESARTELIRERRDGESGLLGAVDEEEESDSGLSSLLSGFAGGIGGGIMAGLGAVLNIFKVVGTTGLRLLKLGAKATGIGAVIMSIYDFVNGFMDAGELLQKEEGQVNIGDRIVAGFSSVVGELGKMVDWVLEQFNIDIIDSEDLSGRIARKTDQAITAIFDFIFSTVDQIVDFVKDFDPAEAVNAVKEQVSEFIDQVTDIVPNMVNSAIDSVTESLSDFSDWAFGDSDEGPSEEAQTALRSLRNQGMTSITPSSRMADEMNRSESASNEKSGGSSLINAPVQNTTNNNNTTVTPVSNTSNPDSSFLRESRRNQIQFAR